MDEEPWAPLVDEPIGDLVAAIQAEDAEVAALTASPRRQLTFRTFAYLRVGLVLGELLMDSDVPPADLEAWAANVLAEPRNRERVVEEVRTVARDVAADPRLAEEDEGEAARTARERFLRFARDSLGA